jgi:hypothetical protein
MGYVVVGLAVVAVAGVFAFPTSREFPAYNVDVDDVAIHGYDPVAYFTEGRPMKGKIELEYVWQDARWQFVSEENRNLFTANPDRYSPQYGGYCALGISAGEFADIDPEAWSIVDGKLYLNKIKEYTIAWDKAPAAYVKTANYNWVNNRDQLRDAF